MAVLLISNIASSAKIIDWGVSLPVLGLPLAFDAGTLLFPISYIFGDVLTEVYGYARQPPRDLGRLCDGRADGRHAVAGGAPARRGDLAGRRPGRRPTMPILGGVSNGGIIVASLVAYFCGEFTNSFILAKHEGAGRRAAICGCAPSARRWWARGSIRRCSCDRLRLRRLSVGIALSIIVANYIFKVGIEVLFTPVTYRVVGWLKRAEHEDYYDTDTDFNPFKVAV